MLQGFWKALSAYDGAVEVFGQLLLACDEFSVKLDYSVPTSGGEWHVDVAHNGTKTTFVFPRLNFDARVAYNQLSQRLDKARRLSEPVKEKEVEDEIFEDREPVKSDEGLAAGGNLPNEGEDVGAGKLSPDGTQEVTATASEQPGTASTTATSDQSTPDDSEGKSVNADGQTDPSSGAPEAGDGTKGGGSKSKKGGKK